MTSRPKYIPPPNAENPALLSAMDRDARLKDWPSRQHVYKTILESRVLLPLVELPAKTKSGEKTELLFAADAKPNGEKWIALFTDEEAFREWDTVHPFVRLPARTAFTFLLKAGLDLIYINPFRERPTRPGGWLTKAEFEMLASGIIPVRRGSHQLEMKIDSDSTVKIEPPTQPLRADIIDALRDAAVGLRGLTEIVHIRLSIGSGPAHDALGLVIRKGIFQMSLQQIANRLMSRIQPLLGEGQSLDVVPLERRGSADVYQGDPIWRKA
jgi:SseB protein N-terminal domain